MRKKIYVIAYAAMNSFWHNLPRPILVLAPLADVTDPAFRRVIAKYSAHERADGTIGGPDVLWTEFVSADGLVRAKDEGLAKLKADLQYSEEERPIVAQLFSSTPAHIEAAAYLCAELGFDGVDINMGCPDRSVEKQGCGAAMIKNPENARAVIRAAKEGVARYAAEQHTGAIPVSVKTRIGYNHDQLEEWLPELLAEEPVVVTVHARTRKEMSKVPARWEHVQHAVTIRDRLKSDTLIFGNGDIASLEDAKEKVAETGADGVMLGRAIFGNPWLFHPEKDFSGIPLAERLCVLVEHTKLFEELLPHKNFAIMKKHYKSYLKGATDLSETTNSTKELRMKLMDAVDAIEVEKIVTLYIDNVV